MKTSLVFDQKETKKLLCKLDFEYFLKQNIKEEDYTNTKVSKIYEAFESTKSALITQKKENKIQFNHYCEGQVRKMFTGGLLPSTFGLDNSRGYTILDFYATGVNWAYFDQWQRYYKKKLTLKKSWNVILKVSSLVAIAWSILKLIELFY